MFRQAQVYAYDVLDQVQVTIRLQEYLTPESPHATWTTVSSSTFRSTGEDDRTEWIKDALIAALEAL